MSESIVGPIVLQLLGVVVVGAEIILPSGGILGLVATGLLVYSVYLVFSGLGADVGIFFVLADLIIIPVLMYFGFRMLGRSPLALKTILSKDAGVSSQKPELTEFIEKRGHALTDLRPSGLARIADKRADVVTKGEYVEKGRAVSVIAVRGNQIIVRESNDKDA